MKRSWVLCYLLFLVVFMTVSCKWFDSFKPRNAKLPGYSNDFVQATQHTADVRRRKLAAMQMANATCAHFKAYKPNVTYKDLKISINGAAVPKCP